MQNTALADIGPADTNNENQNAKSLKKEALLRLAEILIKIDQREHIVNREHPTEEA